MKSMNYLGIGILLSLPLHNGHAAILESSECEASMAPSELKELIEVSKKGILGAGDSKAISSFCSDTVKHGQFQNFNRFLASHPKTKKQLMISSDKDVEIAIKGGYQLYTNEDTPWESSQYPDITLRKQSYDKGILSLNINDDLGLQSEAKVREFLQNPGGRKFPESYGESLTEHSQREWNHLKPSSYSDDNQSKGIEQAEKSFLPLCALFSITDAKECESGLKETIKLMTPVNNLTAIPVLKEVLTDKLYAKGASIAAVKIMDKINSDAPVKGNLYDDIYDSFRKVGLDRSKAEDYTWNLLAAYGARGANVYLLADRVLNRDNAATLLALQVIASGVNVLDSRTFKSSHPYSYPKTVTTSCDTGKPYHFWMTAYLSRRLTKQSKNPEAGANAAYLANVGYQMKSTTFGRDPRRAFTTPTYSAANNKIRLDLSVASAGAVFGAQSFKGSDLDKTISVDNGIKAIVEKAEVLPIMNSSDVAELWDGTGFEGFKKWTRIFAPEAPLDVHQKNKLPRVLTLIKKF